jgi:excisionase family DNA binding protein
MWLCSIPGIIWVGVNRTNAVMTPPGAVNPGAYLTKAQLATQLGISPRFVEKLMQRKVLPVVRISRRCVRFNVARVEAALARLEAKELP